MMSNVRPKIMRVLIPYLNRNAFLFMVHFYGNMTVVDFENVVHNVTNVIEKYMLLPITHIYGY